MTDNRLEKLDQRIAQLRRRLQAAERLRDMVRDDPELLDLLGNAEESPGLPVGGNGSTAAKPGRPKKLTDRDYRGGPVAQQHFEKVAAFLDSHGNEPNSISTIASATGMKASQVIQVCYRTHRDAFERMSVPGHKTQKRWRLQKRWKDFLKGENK